MIFFPPPLLIILGAYARSGSLTLSNMCQTVFMRVKLFRRPIYKWRKSCSVLTNIHNLARRGIVSWCRCVWQRGSIGAFMCNSRPNPRVNLAETGGQPYWSRPVSPRGGERRQGVEQDGGISTTLQCIVKNGWYRISSKLTAMSSLCCKGGKITSKVGVVGEEGTRHFQSVCTCIYTSQLDDVTQDLHQVSVIVFFVHLYQRRPLQRWQVVERPNVFSLNECMYVSTVQSTVDACIYSAPHRRTWLNATSILWNVAQMCSICLQDEMFGRTSTPQPVLFQTLIKTLTT